MTITSITDIMERIATGLSIDAGRLRIKANALEHAEQVLREHGASNEAESALRAAGQTFLAEAIRALRQAGWQHDMEERTP